MATLLFKLTHVPFDEADEIRNLLSENQIQYYETDSGFFRVGLDAIWLQNNEEFQRAKALIEEYQAQRGHRQREDYLQQVEQGTSLNLWQKFLTQPVRFVATILAVLFILALSLMPFFYL